MSINSINHDDITDIAHKWEVVEDGVTQKPIKTMKVGEARRRIEMLREIRESGLSIEDARELGLIH